VTEPLRPAPLRTEENDGFWAAAAEGRLAVQRCDACGRWQHPPRAMCPACSSVRLTFVDVTGTGEVYSWSLLHHPQHPSFRYPVVAVLVTLDEGPRLLSNLVGVEPADVRVGLPVQVTFAPSAEGDVPVFRVREAS
jgi:uncharacterized protein